MESLWQKVPMPQFPCQDETVSTDVLVIGGGLTGLLCAYMLQSSGVECRLIEANRIFHGVSAGTTAKVTAQHGLIYHKLLKRFGTEKAKLYLQTNLEAVDQYRKLCSTIPCDFQEQTAYVFDTESVQPLEQELDALRQLNYPVIFNKNPELPFSCAGALGFADQGQLHPGKLAAGLSADLRIYENTRALSYDGHKIMTDRGMILAKKVIVATHFPIFNNHGAYFLKQYQHRSYVLALKNAGIPDGMYVDRRKTGLSLRSYGEYTLLGGGGHRTGKPGGGWLELEAAAQQFFPGSIPVCRWAAQDCMTLDDMPYVGYYSKSTPNLLVATGFNKWGLTGSMAAARLLRDLICHDRVPELFDPSRSVFRPQLTINAVEAVRGLLSFRRPRCPHMGCALHWNPQEHSWDCSCHGSRFDKNGKLLNTPANGDHPKL